VLEALLETLGVDVDRRGFGCLAAGAAVAAMLPEITVPHRVNAAHIRYLEACAHSLVSREREVGGPPLLQPGLRVWQRARARRRAMLAATLADGGDTTSAISEGMTVLSAIEGGARSVRTLNELRPVRVAAGASKQSGAAEFRSRFDTVQQTLIAA
jgi:hypothetical protein